MYKTNIHEFNFLIFINICQRENKCNKLDSHVSVHHDVTYKNDQKDATV
jgi:hypothetical protein